MKIQVRPEAWGCGMVIRFPGHGRAIVRIPVFSDLVGPDFQEIVILSFRSKPIIVGVDGMRFAHASKVECGLLGVGDWVVVQPDERDQKFAWGWVQLKIYSYALDIFDSQFGPQALSSRKRRNSPPKEVTILEVPNDVVQEVVPAKPVHTVRPVANDAEPRHVAKAVARVEPPATVDADTERETVILTVTIDRPRCHGKPREEDGDGRRQKPVARKPYERKRFNPRAALAELDNP